jgi:hypothetical protein
MAIYRQLSRKADDMLQFFCEFGCLIVQEHIADENGAGDSASSTHRTPLAE